MENMYRVFYCAFSLPRFNAAISLDSNPAVNHGLVSVGSCRFPRGSLHCERDYDHLREGGNLVSRASPTLVAATMFVVLLLPLVSVAAHTPQYRTCASDADCPFGRSCQDGSCVPSAQPSGCQTDNDCPTGSMCSNGQCIPSGVTCPDGLYWDGSQCVCPSGQEWNGQQCVSPQSCPDGQYWDGSQCACPSGQEWNVNSQQCVQEPPPPSNDCGGRIVSIEGGGIAVFSIRPQIPLNNVQVWAFPISFLGQDPTTQIPTEYDVSATIAVTYCQDGKSQQQNYVTPFSLWADQGTPITLNVLSPSGFACTWDHYGYRQHQTCTLTIQVGQDDKIVAYFQTRLPAYQGESNLVYIQASEVSTFREGPDRNILHLMWCTSTLSQTHPT
jgi:hypothetical protein